VGASCPHAARFGAGIAQPDNAEGALHREGYVDAVRALDWADVRATISRVVREPQPDVWPVDYPGQGNAYGGLMVRLAWHCAGSYRGNDGRGGCDGGRIRFDPERSWGDNANLDKARNLLLPVKRRFGDGLSWGDLIVLSGSIAMEDMGMGFGTIGFCAGRVDDDNGAQSIALGPNGVQKALAPCVDENGEATWNGNCQWSRLPDDPTSINGAEVRGNLGIGADTMTDIYVNPTGPAYNTSVPLTTGTPEEQGFTNSTPAASVPFIRSTFRRMGMNDSETVALIAGGHTFGRSHGACNLGWGPGDQSPAGNPLNPWDSPCRRTDECVNSGDPPLAARCVFTSGPHGAWSSQPTRWVNPEGNGLPAGINLYFQYLLNLDWDLEMSPAGVKQFKQRGEQTVVDNNGDPIMMHATDLALKYDPAYFAISTAYADNNPWFTQAYAAAWYKLVTRDMGPWSRCINVEGLPSNSNTTGLALRDPQPWQYSLPAPPANPPSPAQVAVTITSILGPVAGGNRGGQQGDVSGYAAILASIAFNCMATYRVTDWTGGCDGGRIRLAPQSAWGINRGISISNGGIGVLNEVKQQWPSMTWADLIVLAGNTAVQDRSAGSLTLPFCAGRRDAVSDEGYSANLRPPVYLAEDAVLGVRDQAQRWGLTLRQAVILMARPRSLVLEQARGFTGVYTSAYDINNRYFVELLYTQDSNNAPIPQFWERNTANLRRPDEFRSTRGSTTVFMTQSDIALLQDDELLGLVQEFATMDTPRFNADFADAWTTFFNADRFEGPTGNVCARVGPTPTPTPDTPTPGTTTNPSTMRGALIGVAVAGLVVGALGAVCLTSRANNKHAGSINGRQGNKKPLLVDDYQNSA